MADVPSIVCSPLSIDTVEQQVGRPSHLEVPLTDDLYSHRSLGLYEGGLLDEKASYSMSFSLQSTIRASSATIRINEHDGLRMQLDQNQDAETQSWNITATLENASRPFALTSGFVRLIVILSFDGGAIVTLCSPDIIALSGEWKQDRNVSAMYEALLTTNDNQPAEWMFADYDLLAEPNAFRDESTDWSCDSIVRMVSSTERVLNIIERALAIGWSYGENLQETPTQIATTDAIAFLDELYQQLDSLSQSLAHNIRQVRALRDNLQAIVDANNARFGGHASLPVLPILDLTLEHEVAWSEHVDMLMTRVSALSDDFASLGSGPLDSDFDIDRPSNQDSSSYIPTRFGLRASIEQWRQFTGLSLSREGRALHVLKPDRIYEYYVLWRLLSWLYNNSFRDDETIPNAIARYPYDTSRLHDLYENEWRVANTYHLTDGQRRVTLYYVPVITGAPLREENGITIHRTKLTSDGTRVLSTSFYTPDYLLVLDDGSGHRTSVALDAKYSRLDEVGAIGRLSRNEGGSFSVAERTAHWQTCKFNTCLEKYRDNTESISEREDKLPNITSVWLLCGRHDKDQSDFGPLVLDTTDLGTSGVMPLSNLTSEPALSRFFSLLGL